MLTIGCGAAQPTDPDSGGQTAPLDGSMGQFSGGAMGTVTVSVKDGHGTLTFGTHFTVQSVPGPAVYMNTTNDVHTGMPVRVAPLQAELGQQTYTFRAAAGVRYTWVLIWCEPVDVPVAEARIPPTP